MVRIFTEKFCSDHAAGHDDAGVRRGLENDTVVVRLQYDIIELILRRTRLRKLDGLEANSELLQVRDLAPDEVFQLFCRHLLLICLFPRTLR